MRKLLVILLEAVALAAATTSSEENLQKCLWGDCYLKVKTTNGYVQGYLGSSCRTGKQFAGFRGIPYAEPPLGELRFKDPVPRKNWDGIWNATFPRHSCVQNGLDGDAVFPEEVGYSEDCLYLNVFTPNLKYLRYGLAFPKAVMVFIHPGAFTTGSSTEKIFSPDFLIDQDVVVVTFNYRLGALGFLSLQNEDVPGNAGLKDQNLVLKWVKENIKRFGGDPSRITIFGQSAGSASVNYHMLSKSSAGLFRNGIMESGTAIASWAYSPPELALQKGLRLAKKVGCRGKDLKLVLNCLQKVPAASIVKYQQKALTIQELFSMRIIAFHPTIEPESPNAFLTVPPFDLMHSGNFTKVPAIIGVTPDEGLMIYQTLIKKDPKGLLLALVGMDLSRFAPYNFHLKPFTKPAIMAHLQISRFYFNSKTLTRALMNNLLELVTDVMFTLPTQLTAAMLADASVPVYNYMFGYDGGYNIGKVSWSVTEVPGVTHGDELGYIFYTPSLHKQCGRNASADSPDEIMIDRMSKMWANFAKTGNPTPNADPKLPQWNLFTSTKRNYFDISKDIVPSDGLKLANMVFWENLIKNLIEMSMSGTQGEAIDDLELPETNALY